MSSGFLGGLFGKKDKNPQQPSATPPAPKPVPAPASKLQPGLTPVPARTNIGAATTQPMVLPKSAGGLKPAKPALISGGKSTQRIVLPGRAPEAGAPGANLPAGNLSLPLGMVVRLLPDSVRSISLAEVESLPDADQDVSLPLALILPQLPSGKVEVPVQELVSAIPRQYVKPQEEIASQLGTLVSMPLMDVVMRIPPDLLALRPDQKEVDAAVVNMADPFTEELLREQAEAARKAEAEKQAASAAPAPSPTATTSLPEGMPTIPLPRPAAGKPPGAPIIPPPSVPTPTPARSAAGPRPPSITLPRPNALRPPTPSAAAPIVPPAPAPTAATLPPPPAPAPIAPPPAPIIEPTAVEEPAPAGGLTDEMKKLLAAAEAQLGEEKSEAPAPEPTPEPEPIEVPAPVEETVPQLVVPAPVPAPAAPLPPPPAPAPIAPPPPAPAAPLPPPPAPVAIKPPAPAPMIPPPPAPKAVAPVLPPPPAPKPIAPAPVASAPLPPPPPAAIPAPKPIAAAPLPPPPPAPPAPVLPEPVVADEPVVEEKPVSAPTPIATPVPAIAKASPAPAAPSRSVDLNHCTVDDLAKSGCPRLLAEAIVRYRTQQGNFHRLEDLLKVPGITKATYALLTGRDVTPEDLLGTLNEVLGFPATQEVSLKDITERICQWPDVLGCVLGQATGLPLVGKVPAGVEKSAVMAFVPRLLTDVNTSFKEFSSRETNELVIPTKGTSYHIFRNDKLYLVILSRRRQLPRRYMKVARYVLSSIDASRHQ